MKVLMFGWEYPPHISGGLGTACFGLTTSLASRGVDILFVVPKLFGGEQEIAPIQFLSADGVTITRTQPLITPFASHATRVAVDTIRGAIDTLAIESTLSPYFSPHFQLDDSTIESWNYEISPYHNDSVDPMGSGEVIHERIRYKFSGSYGPELLKEVSRYAEVGGEIAKENSFDVIHAHDWLTYRAGLRARQVSGKPLVVHVHATEFDRAGENVHRQVWEIEREGFENADQIVTVSQLTKDVLINRYGIAAEKIEVVHNGVIANHQPADFVHPVGSHIVTFAGRITYQKGPQYFVAAAQKVLTQFPDAHFVMVGAGDMLPAIIERVAALRISSHFHFTGFLKHEQMEKIWSTTDVYVMPSVSEPFGITPLEAIRRGVPVVISNQSGVAEVMPHAMKVDFWDVDALAEAIASVLRYPSLSNTLREQGLEQLEEISWDAAAEKFSGIYEHLTNAVVSLNADVEDRRL